MNRIPQYDSLIKEHQEFLQTPNSPAEGTNGIYRRYINPVITAAHAPVSWRYDLNAETNPLGLERIGVNATFNPGAIKWKGKYVLAVRVEGADRKSFFAMAESPNGIDDFRFWEEPVVMPQTSEPDTNVYDMRLTEHEDGWIYGIFCTERKDRSNPDTSAAVTNAGIARTRDLVSILGITIILSNRPTWNHWHNLPRHISYSIVSLPIYSCMRTKKTAINAANSISFLMYSGNKLE